MRVVERTDLWTLLSREQRLEPRRAVTIVGHVRVAWTRRTAMGWCIGTSSAAEARAALG
jgi:hypothetical protein